MNEMLFLSYKCNWRCPYCHVWKDEEINEEEVLKRLEKIKDSLGDYLISGGEPGLFSDDFWCQVFDMTSSPLSILTNGTFILNGYYEKFRSKIKEIQTHAVPELDKEINPKLLELKEKYPDIRLVVVVNKQNYHLLDGFLTRYKHLKFGIMLTGTDWIVEGRPTDYVIDEDTAKKIIPILSKHGYQKASRSLMKAITSGVYSFCGIPSDGDNI